MLSSSLSILFYGADFEEGQQPEQGIATIKTLQKLFEAHLHLHLLQIIDKPDALEVPQVKKAMQQFADRHELNNYELQLHSDHKVSEGIYSFNHKAGMDLVCIGTHARKGISHLFYGSIAETLVNQCIRPVLTYHLED